MSSGVSAPQPSFVHLRVRSAYSLLNGALTVKKIASIAASQECVAVGVTDVGNLFGALEFAETLAEKGIQPIMGLTLPIALDKSATGALGECDGIVALFAQNDAGWENLMALSSAAYLDISAAEVPHVPFELLQAHSEGLLCLTGGGEGVANRLIAAGRDGEGYTFLQRLEATFPDRLYIELQRHGMADEAKAEPFLIDYAYARGLPLVATNDVRFESSKKYASHDVLLAIADGTHVGDPDRVRVTPNHYFRTASEMAVLFADLPEALENTIDVARRCAVRPRTRAPILPHFSGAAGRDEPAELAAQAREGLKARLEKRPMYAELDDYQARLELEIGVIARMGFSGYFLIVADFIKWAKQNGIPVGPGRGSGAGSLVAYALTITDLDPLQFGLLFERFLNPERVSMPDFDIDFCQERRGEVIEYVKQRYGSDRVAQIITFGTLQARAAVRDVGRALQLPLGLVDRLAKMIPNNPAAPVTLEQAIEGEPRLQEARDGDADVQALLTHATALEGLYRNASTHAAGVVIGDRPLVQLTPLYRDPRGDLPATQYNMKWVEPAGLVKFDFLGLKTLTVIDRAIGFLRRRGINLDLDTLPFDDEATFGLLASGSTLGVFQLESTGMRDTLRKMRADTLDDIIALISLYRPGPMRNIDLYCEVKHGKKDPDYLHPSLEAVLKETYGIIIYQEQVMQIAQILSGYSLGEADLLRRAMGKKKKEEMDAQKARFVSGAVERGVDAELADRIFELVAEFAGYGFNKSHAAAYAVIAYQTAYLKANHGVEFMAASMSLDIGDTDKLGVFVQDAKRMGLEMLPPDINASAADFEPDSKRPADAVRYALGAVKSVGLGAMQSVIAERRTGGPFSSLYELMERVDPRQINRRTLETLAKAGAFDGLEPDRARVAQSAELLVGHAARAAEERASAQTSLFGGTSAPIQKPVLPFAKSWHAQEKLDNEFAALGVYLSGHPLDDLAEALKRNRIVFWSDVAELVAGKNASFRMAGIVRSRKERPARDGGKLGWLTLSDPTGEYEVMVMPETLTESRELLDTGRAITFEVCARYRDGDLKLSAEKIAPLDKANVSGCAGLRVFMSGGAQIGELARISESLKKARSEAWGELRLVLRTGNGAEVELTAPGRYPIDVASRRALKTAIGVEQVLEF